VCCIKYKTVQKDQKKKTLAKDPVDRYVNAAKNIFARGMLVVTDTVQGEVRKQSKNAEQIVLCQVSSQQTKT
jgi:hypothetical protein